MSTVKPLVELKDVFKKYTLADKCVTILHGISLAIHAGEMIAVIGASGSGKSTAMNIMGMLDKPTEGQYLLHGEDVVGLNDDKLAQIRNKTIGFVFQQFFLLPKLTAEQNVALPLTYRNVSKHEIKTRVHELMDKVGMSDRMNHRPSELSGGQQQRVAIARALVGDPELILADEPTGALDSHTSDEVMKLLIDLNELENRTIVIVTHDSKVSESCGRVVTLSDGRIVKEELKR